MLIVALAAGLLTQFFPRCAFAIRIFSKVSATPDVSYRRMGTKGIHREKSCIADVECQVSWNNYPKAIGRAEGCRRGILTKWNP